MATREVHMSIEQIGEVVGATGILLDGVSDGYRPGRCSMVAYRVEGGKFLGATVYVSDSREEALENFRDVTARPGAVKLTPEAP